MVTIISLSYNSAELKRSIDSVIKQTYNDIEYILIDDHSDCFDADEIQKYINDNKLPGIKKVTILINEKNEGTVYSLNRAISASTGSYIFNLAGDDRFHDNCVISDWVQHFNSTGSIVSAAKMAVYKDNKCTGIQPDESQIEKIRSLSPQELFNDMAVCNYIFGCCTARSRQCIEEYGLFDERYRYIEDHPMNLKLLRNGVKFSFFDRIVVDYSYGGISAPTTSHEGFDKDVAAIFENEVLPYVESPQKFKKQFMLFKKRKRFAGEQQIYMQKLEKYKGKKIAVLLIKGVNCIRHPSVVINKIRRINN